MKSAAEQFQLQLEAAARELTQGNLDAAESMCRGVGAADPHERAMRENLLGLILNAKGMLGDALKCYRSAHGLWPEHPGICFNLGSALSRVPSPIEALPYLERAAALAPEYPEAQLAFGEACEAAGLPERAIESYGRVLELDPEEAAAHRRLALLLLRSGRPEAALQHLEQLLAASPDDVQALHNLGMARHMLGRHREAVTILRRAVSLSPGRAETHYILGDALRELDDLESSAASLRTALRLAPDDARYHFRFGLVSERRGEGETAETHLRRAIELDPAHVSARHELGIALRTQGRIDEAAAELERCVELQPANADALNDLGVVRLLQCNLDQAERCFRRCLEIRPDHPGVHRNIGNLHWQRGEIGQARACYERTLAAVPGDIGARWNLSNLLLLQGEFAEGWRLYESRLPLYAEIPRFSRPRWRGEPLDGRTILLHTEQGLGDTIQFARYAALVAQRGGEVILACQPALRRLLARMAGVRQVLAEGEPTPDFDLYCPLMSVPLACGTVLETIPAAIPYVHADAVEAAHWRARIGEAPGLKAGLVWAGEARRRVAEAFSMDRRRSVPLAEFAPLSRVKGVRFFSLQKGSPAAEAINPPGGMLLLDYASELNDFSDTAALVENLDLIVTVDTSVAHLAGAMGKPVWLLSRLDGCWRWLLDREDSPWYPTMRIFRQRVYGDWSEVMLRIEDALRELVAAWKPH